MKKRISIFISVALGAVLLTGVLGIYFYKQVQNLETYRPVILDLAKKALDRDVQYASGHVSIGFGPVLTFEQVAVLEKDGRGRFASAARLTVKAALLPYLFGRKIVVKEISLEQPHIAIVRDKEGKWNIDDLLGPKKDIPLEISGLTVRGGAVAFLDQWITPEGVQADFTEVGLKIDGLQRGSKTAFHVEGVFSEGGRTANLGMEGTLYPPRHDEPLIDRRIDARLRVRGFDLAACRPYCGGKAPFQKLDGLLDADLAVKGLRREFNSSGSLELKNVKLQYPVVFPVTLAPSSVRLVYDLNRTPGEFAVNKAEITVDDVRIKGRGAIRELGKEDPVIEMNATLGPFDLGKYGQYVPYGLMPAATAAFIKGHIRAGVFNMREGSLRGRLNQLRKWGAAGHDNLLLVKTSVAGGVLDFGGSTPVFNGIRGELVFSERDIQLNQMTGLFGTSPVTLTGKIAGYSLPEPAAYPFQAAMEPTNRELAWLIGEDAARMISFGAATLKMSGKGPFADYVLNGEWNLTPVRCRYGDVMSKPAGVESRLRFAAAIRDGKLQLDPLDYSLGPLVLSGTLTYPLKDANQPLSMSLRTNKVNLRDLQPCFPDLKRRRAEGLAQAAISGEKGGKAGTPDRRRGDITLEGISLQLSEKSRPVREVKGVVSVDGEKVSFANLSGRYGETPFAVAGEVGDFKTPAFSLAFSLPFFRPEDFGYRSLPSGYRIRDVSGDLSCRNDLWQVRSLSARLNDAVVTARGTLQDGRERIINGDVSFSYLNGDELAAMMKAEQQGENKTAGPPVSVKAAVRAAAGKYGDLSFSGLNADVAYNAKTPPSPPLIKAAVRAAAGRFADISFKDLNTALGYNGDKLEVSSLTWAEESGRVNARGATRFPAAGLPRHHYRFDLDRVPAESLFRTAEKAEKDRRVKGTVTASGELTATGKTAAELKATAAGPVRIDIQKGTIRKVNSLYKIFSVLNMSQLLKFKLPDLTADGMPYNSITANLLLKNGIMTSKDFFIDSDIINILAMGSMDIIQERIDLRVGLQPLQTLDKIVSRIPVMGWILTDEDKRFITVYFEVKGPVEDPQVRAIPGRELSAEGLDMVKRVFKLPQKLITDTGEILY